MEYPEEMEMPCRCQRCGEWFDLNDGHTSEKWYPDTVICESCGAIEEQEIELEDEIQDIENSISDAEYTLRELKPELNKLKTELKNLQG